MFYSEVFLTEIGWAQVRVQIYSSFHSVVATAVFRTSAREYYRRGRVRDGIAYYVNRLYYAEKAFGTF